MIESSHTLWRRCMSRAVILAAAVVIGASTLSCCVCAVYWDTWSGYDVMLKLVDEAGEPVADAAVEVHLMTEDGELTVPGEHPTFYGYADGMYLADFRIDSAGGCSPFGGQLPDPMLTSPALVEAIVTITFDGATSTEAISISDDMVSVEIEGLYYLVDLGTLTLSAQNQLDD